MTHTRMTVVEPDTDDAPQVMALVSGKPGTPEMRDLFSIDGVTYQIRTSVSPNVSLKFLHLVRTKGWNFGTDYLLEKLLTPGALDALLDFDSLDPAEFQQIINIVVNTAIGEPEEEPKIPN